MVAKALRNLVLAFVAEAVVIGLIFIIVSIVDFSTLPELVMIGLQGSAILALLVPILAGIFLPMIPPVWLREVEQTGIIAPAEVIRNDFLPGRWSYSGENIVVDVAVCVQPEAQPAFEAMMKCRLMQAIILNPGSHVTVKYDARNPKRVMLATTDIASLIRGGAGRPQPQSGGGQTHS
jgi:hypothetical protein